MELYQSLGFGKNPFSTFSAEEEKSFLGRVYVSPPFYDTIKNDIASGHSRFLLGARGIGKTALLFQLKEAVVEEGLYAVIVDDFDEMHTKNNRFQFLSIVLTKLVTNFSIELLKDRKRIKRLSKHQKEKLSLIMGCFFKTLSRCEYEDTYASVSNYKIKNFFIHLYNLIFNKPLNVAISGGIEIVSETVRKSLGLPPPNSDDFYKKYIPEMRTETIKTIGELDSYRELKSIFQDFTFIVRSCGFKNTVIFFDKIDEYAKLNGNIVSISNFLSDFLQDTDLLMSENCAFVFSLWDALKPELAHAGVRFDKIKPVDITWNNVSLVNMLEKRISFFSDKKKSLQDIFETAEYENTIDAIIELSSKSPRYLLRQLSYIYDAQAVADQSYKCFSKNSIAEGQLTYAKLFEYYAIYPSKKGSKEDILSNINRLLKIGKLTVRTKDYADVYKVSVPTAISYIKIAQEYNLIKELPETDAGAKLYDVLDPVIKHLIKSGVDEIKK